ncbi:Isochorismatase-like protein [Dactylonectria estremocensis]|uniref:Isochorismatase-like protein n=1 Tax=Dactylonectria estremocensis TaxID=1079267 RepID=A0A9P9DJB8_9HYPO|nr:Isochorismatase-like protein [Dactylonectria estremocensis]
MNMTTPFLFRELLGVPPSTATTSDSTLIIIDAQNEYAEGKLKVVDVAATRKVIASLLNKYRAANGNVIHVLHATPEGAPVFTPGTKLAEEFDELTPKEGEKVIYKNFPGSFASTDLQEHLEKLGSKKIVLTGYMAHVCVSTTARQAAQRGYDVVVVEDAVGDRDIPGVGAKQLVKVALSEIADAFGTIVQSSSIA